MKAKKVEKKLSAKERLAAKKEEKKFTKKPKKEEKVSSKGRPKGVKYVLVDKVQKALEKTFDSFEKMFKEFDASLFKFIENGNKSAAKNARKCLMDMSKLSKDFRKQIQEAKENVKQEPMDD